MKTKPQLEFYVYIHFRNDDGLPFYVGKGRANRAWRTDGGEGVAGWKPSDETKARMSAAQTGRKHSDAAKAKMGLTFKKPVYCSNGMKFDGAGNAAKFVSGKANVISRCAAGLRKSAYGLAWSYIGFPKYEPLLIDACRKEKQSAAKKGKVAKNVRAVLRSDGARFSSIKDAADFMIAAGSVNATNSAICACCTGRKKSAYGYSWKYEKE